MNTVSILTICAFLYLAFVTWMFRGKGNKTQNKTQNGKAARSPAPDDSDEDTEKEDTEKEDTEKEDTEKKCSYRCPAE